jgi:hypothetical protein
LINSQESKIARRRSLPALPPKQILEALFAAPWGREKRRTWKKVPEKN